MPEESNTTHGISQSNNKNWKLRGVQWRVDLDVLPRKPAPVDELRRAAADGRRRYAELRRRLLVDPHLMENCQTQAQLNQDNPLSLDPESVWGQYFRNTELERTIDKDLMRLYPENGSFFQSPGCQAILRRILLVWSLIHPESSYRQDFQPHGLQLWKDQQMCRFPGQLVGRRLFPQTPIQKGLQGWVPLAHVVSPLGMMRICKL